jgi:cytochrome oxidase Cu insertion factor (SCO1/SenC/PrrC family)
VKSAPETKAAKGIAGLLYEYRNLSVGCVAPDFHAEDVDGAAFQLSDYRGKVVLVDFWGFW